MNGWNAVTDERKDVMERIDGALVQHGPEGNRIYLMSLPEGSALKDRKLVETLGALYDEKGYTKIFAKVPASRVVPFLLAGYCIEAFVPRMYHGVEDLYFLAYYGSGEARRILDTDEMNILDTLLRTKKPVTIPPLSGKYRWFHCSVGDIPEMAALYAKVFPRYPFPIDDPEYLGKTMRENVEYFGIRDRQSHKLVSLASAEYHRGIGSTEMTDFAVLPEIRGEGLALFLLARMEAYAAEKGVPVAYTIARLRSPGMNATFLKGAYHYAGTLPNNTFIGGGLESMNVFYKVLLPVTH
jgi:beta-lysine N6-acetyltransferase